METLSKYKKEESNTSLCCVFIVVVELHKACSLGFKRRPTAPSVRRLIHVRSSRVVYDDSSMGDFRSQFQAMIARWR